MPCQSYDSSWDRADDDRQKIKELKKQADMLARISCKALTELEKNEVEDIRDNEYDNIEELGAIVEFTEPFEVSTAAGMLVFGHVKIETDFAYYDDDEEADCFSDEE